MNTSTRITLERNEANRLLEADLLDTRIDRQKLSAALFAKLASHLTEEQKRMLRNGESVSLSLKDLKGEARTLAQDYARQGLIAPLPDGMALNLSRLGDFALNFSASSLVLGIDGYLTDGREIHY